MIKNLQVMEWRLDFRQSLYQRLKKAAGIQIKSFLWQTYKYHGSVCKIFASKYLSVNTTASRFLSFLFSGSINLLCVPLGCFMSGMLTEATGKRRAMQVRFRRNLSLISFNFIYSLYISNLSVDCESSNVSIMDIVLLFVQHISFIRCLSYVWT